MIAMTTSNSINVNAARRIGETPKKTLPHLTRPYKMVLFNLKLLPESKRKTSEEFVRATREACVARRCGRPGPVRTMDRNCGRTCRPGRTRATRASDATDVNPDQAGRRAAAFGGGDSAALRAEGAAAGGAEAAPGQPRAGREALRGPQGQAVLRLPADVPDGRPDGGDGVGGPRGGGGGADVDGRDRRHQGAAGDHPRRLRAERAEQPRARQRQ